MKHLPKLYKEKITPIYRGEKMRKHFYLQLFILFVVTLFLISSISAKDFSILNEKNITDELKAKVCLKDINSTIITLNENNFSTQRIADTLEETQALYDSQLRKLAFNKDFSNIIENCEDVAELNEIAYFSRDEYNALIKFYDETLTPDMDTSEADLLISEVEKEIENERYELVGELVDESYDKIIEIRASYGALETIKKQTANFFIKLVTRNWQIKLVVIFILIVLYYTFRKKIMAKYITFKINRLQIRRKTLKNLIKKMQRNYFQDQRISEGAYNIKTKKFAEMIRDIDRQVPLLQEQLAKVSKQPKLAFLKSKNETSKENQK